MLRHVGDIAASRALHFHNPPTSLWFHCWFSNNSVITFLEGCFPSSFVAEVGIFFSILLFQWSIFYYFFRRHCDVALFTHHLELWGSCFLAYPFNRRVVSSLQYLFISASFLLFSTGVLSKFCHSCSLAISLYRGGQILFVREALISMSFNLQVLVILLVPLF